MKIILPTFILGLLVPLIFSLGYTQNLRSGMTELTITEAANLIATGQLSSETLTLELLEQIEQNLHLNIFITINRSGALLAAKNADKAVQASEDLGPLHGVPIVVKDNIAAAGLPNSLGVPALLKYVPNEDAVVIQTLLDAGAIILGKTNFHNFALRTGNNNSFDTVANPYNPNTLASDGTAAAVAARMAPVGLGKNNRVAASLNGVVGFKPSVGSYSQAGIAITSNTLDTAGVTARSVADVVLLDGVIHGEVEVLEPANLKGLRIGIPQPLFYDNLDKETERLVARALTKVIEAGVEIIEADLDNISALNQAVRPLASYEALQLIPVYLTGITPSVNSDEIFSGLDMQSVLALDKNQVNEEAYQEIIDKHRPALQEVYHKYFEEIEVEAVIFPTTPLPARLIKDNLETVQLNHKQVPTFLTYTQNTEPASNAGLPALTIPIGLTPEGLPVGIEIDGPQGSDKRLLQIGLALEKVLGKLPAPNLP